MKTKNLLMLFALAGIMVFASCKKDDSPSPLTKDEATAELNSTTTGFTDIKGSYDESDAGQMQSFLDSYSLPFDAPLKSPSAAKSFKENIKRIAKPSANKAMGDYGPFVYINWDSNVGTYTWNSSTSNWDHTSTPTNQIVVIFPYKSGLATLTYYNYTTKSYTYDSETYTYVSSLSFKAEYTPTGGAATTVYSWQYTASRSNYNKGNLKYVYTLGDFSQTEAYSINVSTDNSTYYNSSISTTFEVKYQGDVVYGQYATISSTESKTGYKMSIDARVRLMSIVVKWDIDWNNTTDRSNPNNYMKVSVWKTDGAKVADIVMLYDETEQDYIPWFEYADGTQEKVSDKLGNQNDEGTILYMFFEFIDSVMNIFN